MNDKEFEVNTASASRVRRFHKSFVLLCGLMGCTSLFESTSAQSRTDVDTLDLELLLDNIVVSVSKHEETLEEAPGNVFLITREMIDDYGFESVADALAIVPGLYVNKDFSFTNIGVRGISLFGDWNSRIIVLIDGRSSVEMYSGTSSFDIPGVGIDNVERIEVVKGPASSLYGSNAFFATVNLITRKSSGNEAHGASTISSATRSGQLSAGITHYWKPDFSICANLSTEGRLGSKLYFPEFSVLDSATLSLDENGSNQYYMDSADFTGGYADRKNRFKAGNAHIVLRKGAWSLTGKFSEDETGIAQSMWGSVFNRTENKFIESRHFVDFGTEQALTPNLDLSAHVSYDYYRFTDHVLYNYYSLETAPPYLPGPVWVDWESDNAFSTEARINWHPTSRTSITIGADAKSHRISQESGRAEPGTFKVAANVIPVDVQKCTGEIYTVYSQVDHRFSDRLKLVGGLQVNYQTYTSSNLMPKAAAIFSPSRGTTLKAIATRGYRAPTFYELTFDDRWFYIGNKNLKPELITNYEFVVSQQTDYGFSATASVYRSDYKGLIVQSIIDSTDPDYPTSGSYSVQVSQFRNQGEIHTTGTEFTLQRNPIYRLSGFGSVNYNHVRLRAEGGATLPNSIEWVASGGIMYQWMPRRLYSTLKARYNGSRLMWDGSPVAGATVLDASVTCKKFLGELSATIGITNVLNKKYRIPLSQDFAPSTTIDQPGRSVFVKLSVAK